MTEEQKSIGNLQLLRYKLTAVALAPGTAVCTLGVIAGIYALVPPEWLHPLGRSVGILLIIFLGAAELAAIRRADIVQNQRFESVLKLSNAHQQSILRLMQSINDPAEGLKRRALQLSESILNFAYDRMQDAPQTSITGQKMVPLYSLLKPSRVTTIYDPLKDVRESYAYEQETLTFYRQRFTAKVQSILREFSGHGIDTGAWQERNRELHSSPVIISIGEALGNMAEMVGREPRRETQA